MVNPDPEKAQPTETQRAATTANRFYDMAERGPGVQDPKIREMFSNVGRETADGGYEKAQRILEGGAQWDDNLRGAASEVNQLDQEKRGVKPMSFEDVQKGMSDLAREIEKFSKTYDDTEQGRKAAHEDRADALKLDSIVGGTSRPGVEGIDDALTYVEGRLQRIAKNVASGSKLKPGDLEEWQGIRATRDALYQEKQKRIERAQQAQRATKEVTEARGSTTRGLENMFNQAGVSEDLPSRQELVAQVGRMSPEEMHLFHATLKKAGAEFVRTGDPALLQARLEGLQGKSWKREDVERRQKVEDQRKIKEIRRGMGLPEQPAGEESPEERFKKFQNYENHKDSAHRVIIALQDVRRFESSNDTTAALELVKSVRSNLEEGDPLAADDRRIMQEAKSALESGKTIKEAVSTLERQLKEMYGVSQINLSEGQPFTEVKQFDVRIVATQETDNPQLVGRIQEIVKAGYHIPDIPQSLGGKLSRERADRSIKAPADVVVYKART